MALSRHGVVMVGGILHLVLLILWVGIEAGYVFIFNLEAGRYRLNMESNR